jgi:hypothetical protein
LSTLVGPPFAAGSTWSICRIGASHQGVAGVVAGDDEAALRRRETAAVRVHRDQVAGLRVPVEPTDPHRRVVGSATNHGAGDGGRDRPVARQLGRLVHPHAHAHGLGLGIVLAGPEQCLIGHQQLDLH